MSKPRVALVRAPIVFATGSQNNEATPSIAFAYLSSSLSKHGYSNVWADAIAEGLGRIWSLTNHPGFHCQGLTFEETLALIPDDVEVIGFSCMFSGEWVILRELITEARKKFPHALFVAGGEHVTAMTEYSLRDCPAIDVCVLGEGERTFVELLDQYTAQGKSGFASVGGIGFFDENRQFVRTSVSPLRIKNVDEIPWPHWPEGYLEKFWAAGKSYGISSERDMPFLFSRGCPYSCTFCSNPLMWSTKYNLRDIDDVVAELKTYIKRYDITAVQLYDLTAIIRKDWIVAFCNRILAEGIHLKWSFPSGTRSEVLDDEALTLLEKIGCKYLVYAPESGSKKTLDLIKKKVKLPRLTQSVLTAQRLGIATRINLIIGFPGETWRDVFETIQFGLKMAFKGVEDVPLFVFSPYPGTEIFQNLVEGGRLRFSDDYFFSLSSLNGAYFAVNRVVSYNPDINAKKLGVARTFFILCNYMLSYLCHPSRMARTFKNLFTNEASTVFEHRLKDKLKNLFSFG